MSRIFFFISERCISLIVHRIFNQCNQVLYRSHAIFRTDAPFKSLIIQHEVEPIVKALGAGSDNEFLNNEMLVSVEKSGNVGIGRFDQACLVTMT